MTLVNQSTAIWGHNFSRQSGMIQELSVADAFQYVSILEMIRLIYKFMPFWVTNAMFQLQW
jgi:hypothetical protein